MSKASKEVDKKKSAAASTGAMFAAKKAEKDKERMEAQMYSHLDPLTVKMLKKSLVAGIKTARDPAVSLNSKIPYFEVKGLTFRYNGMKLELAEDFVDFFSALMTEVSMKVLARAVIHRNNPEDRGRSHSRILPVFMVNMSSDVPIPESAVAIDVSKVVVDKNMGFDPPKGSDDRPEQVPTYTSPEVEAMAAAVVQKAAEVKEARIAKKPKVEVDALSITFAIYENMTYLSIHTVTLLYQ